MKKLILTLTLFIAVGCNVESEPTKFTITQTDFRVQEIDEPETYSIIMRNDEITISVNTSIYNVTDLKPNYEINGLQLYKFKSHYENQKDYKCLYVLVKEGTLYNITFKSNPLNESKTDELKYEHLINSIEQK